MEDIPNPSQSDAEHPQPPANHNRPFFYVQPPSQPYFMYQWPMDPFGQYGFLGPALPFGRPYMSPYQFMPYPGYVVPHVPMQPTDHRRVGPLFPSVSSYDLRFRQHFQQMSLHRETTSSEVQTEHGYPVSTLTGSQESLKTCEKTEADKEPKVMFSTPGVISFTHEVDKMSYADELNIEPAPQFNKVAQDKLINPVTLCDSAVYNGMSSQDHLEDCVLSDVLPLDSSSIRDEIQNYKRDLELSGVHSAKSGACPISNACHSSEGQDSGAHVSDCSGMSNLFESKSSVQNQVANLSSDCVAVIEPLLPIAADCDLPYQILRLPCNKTTTGLLLQKELDSLPYMDSSAILPSKHYAFGSTYSHNYYPQVVPARQSVLGPSLDELSSRDEMFSTDAEDEPPSGQACVDGGKLAEPNTVPIRSVTDPIDDLCSVWAKTCACCGASLPDEDTSPAELLDQDYDPELEEATDAACIGEGKKSVFVQHPFGHGQSPCAQVSKPKARKLLEYAEPTVQDQDHSRGECAELHNPAAKGGKGRGKAQLSAQFSSYSEHFQRDGPAEVMEQAKSTGCSGKQRSRSCKPANNQQEKGKPARRNPSSNAFAQHRPRRNEYDEAEVSYCQRGRGSTKRRGTRY